MKFNLFQFALKAKCSRFTLVPEHSRRIQVLCTHRQAQTPPPNPRNPRTPHQEPQNQETDPSVSSALAILAEWCRLSHAAPTA